MSRFKAFIFDLDGVIVDTAKYHFKAWRSLANDLGFDFTEEQNEMLKGVSRMKSLELILELGGVQLSEEKKNELAAQKNECYIQYIDQMDTNEILPGIRTFLQKLQGASIPIVLGSASKNAERILKQLDLYDFFQAIVDGNKVSRSKPDPEVFLKGAELVGITPSECIVFEDAPKGIQAAKSAKMYTVGVGQKHLLEQADDVISSFEGLEVDHWG